MIPLKSTSYPTLSVIQAFGITDQATRTAIYDHSAALADCFRGRNTTADTMKTLREVRKHMDLDLATTIHTLLCQTVYAAVRWCKDNATA